MFTFEAAAYSAIRNFGGRFEVDIPDDWIVEEREEDMYVRIQSPDGLESIVFEYATREAMNSHQFAERSSEKRGGTSPVIETDFDVYEFMFREGETDFVGRAFMVASLGVLMISQGIFENLYQIIGTIYCF
jgi:hypothetical protein